jgi:hypothetical protein
MQQFCTYGSVRGALGNQRPYRDKGQSPLAHAPPVQYPSSRCCPVKDFRSSPSVLLARGSASPVHVLQVFTERRP